MSLSNHIDKEYGADTVKSGFIDEANIIIHHTPHRVV